MLELGNTLLNYFGYTHFTVHVDCGSTINFFLVGCSVILYGLFPKISTIVIIVNIDLNLQLFNSKEECMVMN